MLFAASLDLVIAFENASKTVTIRYEGGLLSCCDRPAYEMRCHKGRIECRKWLVRGVLHRDGDLPAYERGDPVSLDHLRKHAWGAYGVAVCNSRVSDPETFGAVAVRQWCVNGVTMRQNGLHTKEDLSPVGYARKWITASNISHRADDQPAYILEAADGSWKELAWRVNGYCHRGGDKPAYVSRDGIWSWYKNGKLHRDNDRPAAITIRQQLPKCTYAIDGRVYTPAHDSSNIGDHIATPW